ncbi:MAG: response regulator transcription factor [Polyangiaceae bacterium]|nr:response regulator transcription factor [Myxococcales bacterium]MCB9585935.1 response regulator transcription factor [Polyangiaceae bacterium]MCB9607135.1 response regulator transcription factor [Polyangiaceae bacterium]
MSSKHILVVDDEARIREVVQYALSREGFRVSVAEDGQRALELAERDPPELVVLDVMLPEIDGLEVCRQLKRRSRVPVLFLSARGEEVDRIVGLELGGDDYLTKPFSPRELVARVRAVLRRFEDALAMAKQMASEAPRSQEASADAEATERSENRGTKVEHAHIAIDFERHEVRFAGARVDLTPTEFGVLAALLERPGIVLSRAQLMDRGYADSALVTERTIDTHIRRIRKKFKELGFDPITTVHGVGYKAAEA